MKIYEDPQIEKIEKLLRRVCFYIKKKGRTILEDYDITPAQFEALQIIVNHKEVTISELSNKLYQAPSTITDLVDRMESKDLVKRVRDSKDRRIVRIEGLEKGHNTLENVSKEDKDSFTEYLDILEHAYTEGK